MKWDCCAFPHSRLLPQYKIPLPLPGKQEITANPHFACLWGEGSASPKLTVAQITALFMCGASVSRKLPKKQSYFLWTRGERGLVVVVVIYLDVAILRDNDKECVKMREQVREREAARKARPNAEELWEINGLKRASWRGSVRRWEAYASCSPS